MRFLGMAGYYRKFCDNYSVLAEPLTNLPSERTKFIWTFDCRKAFDILKAILKNEPVPLASNFAKEPAFAAMHGPHKLFESVIRSAKIG